MKKYLVLFTTYILVMFLLPVIFNNKNKAQDINNKEELNIEINKNIEETQNEYNYKEYSTINLLHKKTNEIEKLYLDDYLIGVISAEMPASYEMEALKAQAVVARTYTIYSIKNSGEKHEGASICDDSNCCQAWISKDDRMKKWDEEHRNEYWEKICRAVNDTKGKVVLYNGEVIDAFFHSNSGGKTESPINVWGGTNYPYLQTVETAGEDEYSQYKSEVVLSKEDFVEKIKQKYSDFYMNFSDQECIKILEYTESGRIKTIKIGNLNLSGVEVRMMMGLKSANFKIEIVDDNVKFEVQGYGHGVGMSQTGADAMAKKGSDYQEIIIHFYSDVTITDF